MRYEDSEDSTWQRFEMNDRCATYAMIGDKLIGEEDVARDAPRLDERRESTMGRFNPCRMRRELARQLVGKYLRGRDTGLLGGAYRLSRMLNWTRAKINGVAPSTARPAWPAHCSRLPSPRPRPRPPPPSRFCASVPIYFIIHLTNPSFFPRGGNCPAPCSSLSEFEFAHRYRSSIVCERCIL